MSMLQTHVATAIERPPAFVRVEVESGRPMEIEYISSGVIPETGPPTYRTKSPGSARVKIFMRRALGLSARFLDGGPIFEIASGLVFEEAQKKRFETGNTLPIYYEPPRSSEPGYFSARLIGWKAIDQVETVQLAGQSEARLSYPAQRLIFVAAGGLIGRSGKRIMPSIDADGITFRFAEPVYGTLHVRYHAEYMDWALEWSMPDGWYHKRSVADPNLTNNDRIARRLIRSDEMKPILVCVDAPPGAGGLPEDRKGHTVWIQMIERSFQAGGDEYPALVNALQSIRSYRRADSPGGNPCALVREPTRSYLTYFGWPARQIPKDGVAYLRKQFLGRETEFSRPAIAATAYGGPLPAYHEGGSPWVLPQTRHPGVTDTLNAGNTPGWPSLPDVAVHWISDGVVIADSAPPRRSVVDREIRLPAPILHGYNYPYAVSQIEYRVEPGIGGDFDYIALKPVTPPSASVLFADLHATLFARCRAYGLDTVGAEYSMPFSCFAGISASARHQSGFAVNAATRDPVIDERQRSGALTVDKSFFALRPFTWVSPSASIYPEYQNPVISEGHAIVCPTFTDETPGRYTPGTGRLVVDWDLAEAL